jgi:hypothetical protein
MSDTTPRLALPELSASQAQKHVTVNEALIKLDCLVDLYFLSRTLTAPPSSPSDGDAYLVASSATGSWSGYDGKIAYRIDAAWRFYTPVRGMRAYNAADGKFYVYTGSAWVDLSTLLSLVGSVLASGKMLVGNADGVAAAVSMSGDATMDQAGAVALAATGVAAATYRSITVDAKGRVTGGSNPSTLAGNGIANAVASMSTFYSSGTWNKPSAVRRVLVFCLGAGGGGGGAAGAASNGACGGGGGAGAISIKSIDVSSVTSVAVTVGSGGTAGSSSGGSGGTGGTSSFGSYCSADGGTGGSGQSAGTWAAAVSGGYGGSATGGDINFNGGAGAPGIRLDYQNGIAGRGSPAAMFGGGGNGYAGNTSGQAGIARGDGGGGGVVANSATGQAGGAGSDGFVWVWEFL